MNRLSSDLSAATWRKSSHSGSGDQCVEVATLASGPLAVRDSKDPHGPALVLTHSAWHSLITTARRS
ncbi:DUF397 domain-containing protein [Spirillospora sp. CA-294931]|uniref:DUF397 domain-containing protein n=1 Tax=Spirillospora sp. CA-294931 TaxID=3240042 RepID=UPI003D8EE05B